MPIPARCKTCGREFLLEMLFVTKFRRLECPFCGVDYTADAVALDKLVAAVEKAGLESVHAIRLLVDIDPGFVIDLDCFLRALAPRGSTDPRSASPPA